jgi:hypothetical protein
MLAALVNETLATFDADTRQRLQRCIPMLEESLNRWCARPVIEADAEVVVCAATPLSAIVLESDRWLVFDQQQAAAIEPAGIASRSPTRSRARRRQRRRR